MEHKLIEGPLLDEKGDLVEAGYSFSLAKSYNKEKIATSCLRIKEWDYYFVGNKEYGLAFTIADNGYMSLVSALYFDFKKKIKYEKGIMAPLSLGKLNLPKEIAKGDISYSKKNFFLEFRVDEKGNRYIKCEIKKFHKKEAFSCDVTLRETTPHIMCIATPFYKKGHFYYNAKKNLLKVEGSFKVGDKEQTFDDKSYGVLDWGRGVWTYKNTWYWSSMNDVTKEGTRIGFNLGYGFGDTSKASENMLFVDDKVYKLGDVYFDIPKDKKGKDDFISSWKIASKDGMINLIFTPIYHRHSDANVLLIRSHQNQVFGTFKGTFKVDGKVIEIPDLFGFAEKVYNRW